MRWIRYFPIWKYGQAKFIRRAFNPADGGISVYDEDCVLERWGNICAHAGQYREATSNPAIYWLIDDTDLPPGLETPQTENEIRDSCHHDIKGLDKEAASIFFDEAQKTVGEWYVCNGMIAVRVSLPDIAKYKPDK